MPQKALCKGKKAKPAVFKKPAAVNKHGKGNKMKVGRLNIKPKRLTEQAKAEMAISSHINRNIEGVTAGQAVGKGAHLKVVKAPPPEEPKEKNAKKKSSLPAHKTQ
uniref:Uncharacterized protein n=1 Tax=Pyramimonas obovata TaxID=1411642 RepID=A0A7S0WJ22_9CHLO|mmetsp:Transcript_27048/g.59014  ORF Transcript_27048/g.59014 Transcript_27048/m.59014 type:complete len:106 (+) Transcript_27048:138-455(+)|eukprot:CAMPEP_0118932392 /NCGR_PEP_ID=MMETSP1169-20130426/10089_1 /TAXON_ID=36882 /ORGANISM="Pyramimonas obovata, Strain CCMP722" /LENGTH=105 /DNA_ID=CAMNT_0006875043 /DNA_START=98 /DNA_END=415 /DNA_ORIENTATION=+